MHEFFYRAIEGVVKWRTWLHLANPVVAWAAPVAITFGSALDSTQFIATANVPRTFVYNPPARAVLYASNNQKLSVTFTPTDSADYSARAAAVWINVTAAPAPPVTGTPQLTLTHDHSNNQFNLAGFEPNVFDDSQWFLNTPASGNA